MSEATIRRLSERAHLRTVFLDRLFAEIDDLGLSISELARGGYGIIRASALEGAPAITAKRYLVDDLKKLAAGKVDFNDLRAEVEERGDDNDDPNDG